jgi:hypothetical protein
MFMFFIFSKNNPYQMEIKIKAIQKRPLMTRQEKDPKMMFVLFLLNFHAR